ncbi:hypothetical protein NDU88_007410 [Pleurodeles waltl]|uniref:Uncharacterized protein n=1 Tax=Pleurodeles waltl TaxID=8319 RepID=A0AAV7QKT4_PLEWA|nr:hypothetical protein NDU88_007410 [Pleurodeles waltl]
MLVVPGRYRRRTRATHPVPASTRRLGRRPPSPPGGPKQSIARAGTAAGSQGSARPSRLPRLHSGDVWPGLACSPRSLLSAPPESDG